MCHIDRVIRVHKQLNRIFHLGFVSAVKLFKAIHLPDVSGFQPYLNARVHPVCKYKLQRTAHIEKRRVMPALGFSRLLRLYTSNNVVLPRILQRQSSADQRRNNNLVVIICRQADACPRQLCRPNQKIMRRTVPHTHR